MAKMPDGDVESGPRSLSAAAFTVDDVELPEENSSFSRASAEVASGNDSEEVQTTQQAAPLSVGNYLRRPAKAVAKAIVKSLKPKDWLLLVYFLYTVPMLFIGVQSALKVVWGGIVIRLLVTPAILFGRYYFAVVPDELHVRRTLFKVGKQRTLVVVLPYIAGFLLDIVHILCAVYFYTEEGLIIKNMWDYPAQFWDDHFKQIDYEITGVSVDEGVGHHLRGLTSHGSTTNRALGEYLSFCYVFFYGVIALAYVVPYAFAPRYNFDQITTGLIMAYLVCLSLFPLLPTAGPYWQYPMERPTGKEIGYFFGPLSQSLIESGSSIGTAFPSSHCAITTVSFVMSLVYFWPLGVAFILVCPAIVFATIWLGNHYVIDSLVGVCIGLVCSALTIIIGKFWVPRIQKPLTGDNMYLRTMITVPKANAGAVLNGSCTLEDSAVSTDVRRRQLASGTTLEEVCVDVDTAHADVKPPEYKESAADNPENVDKLS